MLGHICILGLPIDLSYTCSLGQQVHKAFMESNCCRKKRLSRRKTGPAFEFIGVAGSSGSVKPRTKEAGIIIRRQAARSGRQKYVRGSVGQDEEDPVSITPQVQKSVHVDISAGANNAWPAIHFFIEVDLAVNAFRLLQDESTSPAALLQTSSSSFLAYLPSRYGFKPFLNDAMHCVAAKAAQMLGKPTTRFSPSTLHTKALHSLCSTIQNDPACPMSDIYCATRLLVLYESLGPPDVNALVIHNECGIELLNQEGPSPALSHFEHMLFRSQGPHILISEMYKKKTSMFEAQQWQLFFDSASNKEKSTDAQYWWKFFGCMVFLPGILKDAKVLFSEATLDPFTYSSRSFGILKRAKNLSQALNENHVLYQRSTSQPRSLLDLPSSVHVESMDRVRLQGFLQYPTMFLSRLQATLSLSEVDRAMGEEEAQKVAAQVLLVERMARHSDPAMAWHLGQRNRLPYSIIRTREEWLPFNEPRGGWEDLKAFLAQRWLRWEDSWNGEVLTKELEGVQVKT
ncbi:hypothetical protein F5Y08DRAFT_348412 [Xylaria arbuscula]|nr:hypothetical protein F5Y08DRAFT_348412 [Xylaria arbuscula]